ncbi:MAG: asparagine synthase (glutamine-hydrolyzing) [Candidatus Limnocylindria bacterium]
MCGIAGIVTLNGTDPARGSAARMRDRIAHRGPDGNGEYDAPGVSLAACRLAIVDLEPRGLMPMSSEDGRFHIVHNGEIYNRLELRDALEARGVRLRTTTDTEVILQLFALDGPNVLDTLDGMFAFAIWDEQRRELFAARDRVGEKPFFYAAHEGRLYFASEPKALFEAGLPRAFNEETWLELVSFRSVAGERTVYRGVSTLLPAHWLRAGAGGVETGEWWRYPTSGPAPSKESFAALFERSVENRLIADVPVGTLLSGGLDSSAVTAVAAALSKHRIPSFTVRYDGLAMDEGEFASAAAKMSGVEHHEVRVPAGERPQLLVDATWHLDEPINFPASPEILAVSRYARQHVRVLLTGETADELFGGYGRLRLYRYPRLVDLTGHLLAPFERRLRFGSRWARAVSSRKLTRPEWIAASYADGDPMRFTRTPLHEWAPYRAQVAQTAVRDYKEPVRQAMAYERHTHLPSIVATGDRLTMGAAIEARLSFTDPRLLDFAGLARTKDLFSGPHGKQPLREAMVGRLPKSVLERRKQGWTSPYAIYLRKIPELRQWLSKVPQHEIVARSELGREGTQQVIDNFLAGDNRATRDSWMIGRIVLWHQVCVEGISHPFNGRMW